LEGDTLVIKRITVRYELRVAPDVDRAVIQRVLDFHAGHCPVARSIGGCIAITTDVDVITDAAETRE